MNNNFKNDKFVEVVQEFQIVQGQSVYQIGSIDLKDVYFFVKNGNENYKVLATGQYTVDGVNLTINDPNIILTNTHIQVCRVYSTVASKYISDVVNINTLREHYNVLVDDFINVIDFLRKSGIKSDSSAMNYVFPLLEEGQVFMRKGLGFEGRQIMDINAELQRQIDIAITFFEDYINNQKKPEIDAYTVSKKQELETYTIAKKGEINTLVTGHKTDINTLADTKKTEIIELGNLKQQEIISLSTGKIKEITDVTTVKKQEIETLTAQKKVQITDHTDLEIQKILALGVDNLQTQINTNKSDILLKANKSDILNKENTIEDLIKSRKYEVGDVVQVLGYYSAGDGAGHPRIKKPEGYNGADAVIGADGSIWGIVHSGEVNVSWFGAKGDGVSDDATAIQKAINYSNYIKFDSKTYKTSAPILITKNKKIRGILPYSSTLIKKEGLNSITHEGKTYASVIVCEYDIRVENIGVDGNYENDGISFHNTFRSKFENIYIDKCLKGLVETNGTWLVDLNKFHFKRTELGVDFYTTKRAGTSISMRNFVFENCGQSIKMFGKNYSTLDTIASDYANYKYIENNPYGVGYGDHRNNSVYEFELCNGMTINSMACENVAGTELLKVTGGFTVFNGCNFYNFKSENENVINFVNGVASATFNEIYIYGCTNILTGATLYDINYSTLRETRDIVINSARMLSVNPKTYKPSILQNKQNQRASIKFLDKQIKLEKGSGDCLSITPRSFLQETGNNEQFFIKLIIQTQNNGASSSSSYEVICVGNILKGKITLATYGTVTKHKYPTATEEALKIDTQTGEILVPLERGVFDSIFISIYATVECDVVLKEAVINVFNVASINDPYHATKMQQEGVYEDFIAYMDEKTAYDNHVRNRSDVVDGIMNLNVAQEPVPSKALLAFKEKYIG